MLDRAIRGSVRRKVTDARPSADLRSRMTAVAIAERRRRASLSSTPGMGLAGWVVTAAAAAAATFVWFRNGRAYSFDAIPSVASEASATANAAAIGIDTVIDQFVDWHAQPLPPEVTKADELPGFQPYVGVPVHDAPRFSSVGAHLLGGRILPVREQRVAAMLQYAMQNGHRISLYVYDPRRVRISHSSLHPRVVYGSEPVYLSHVRGFTVTATEREGIGHVIASDLDDDESAELALATAQ
jgi:hypothetical protein